MFIQDATQLKINEVLQQEKDNTFNFLHGILKSEKEFVTEDNIIFTEFKILMVNGFTNKVTPQKGILLFAKHHQDPCFIPLANEGLKEFDLLPFLGELSGLMDKLLNTLVQITPTGINTYAKDLPLLITKLSSLKAKLP